MVALGYVYTLGKQTSRSPKRCTSRNATSTISESFRFLHVSSCMTGIRRCPVSNARSSQKFGGKKKKQKKKQKKKKKKKKKNMKKCVSLSLNKMAALGYVYTLGKQTSRSPKRCTSRNATSTYFREFQIPPRVLMYDWDP